MKEYTVRELRANMREAFEEATKGTVRINRGGEYFYLTQEIDEPDYELKEVVAAKPAAVEYHVSSPERTYKDVLTDITTREKQRDEETDPIICQDPPTRQALTTEAANDIRALWEEYHALRDSSIVSSVK